MLECEQPVLEPVLQGPCLQTELPPCVPSQSIPWVSLVLAGVPLESPKGKAMLHNVMQVLVRGVIHKREPVVREPQQAVKGHPCPIRWRHFATAV